MTMISIPVTASRQTSFDYSFETENGVGIDMTINTESKEVAVFLAKSVATKMGWTPTKPRNSLWSLLWWPLGTLAIAAVVGAVGFMFLMLLDGVRWLPVFPFGNPDDYSSSDRLAPYGIWLFRGLLVATPIITIIGMVSDFIGRLRAKA